MQRSEDEASLIINGEKLNQAINDVKDSIINLELSLFKSDSNRMANELLGLKIEVFSYLQPISLNLIIFVKHKENIAKAIHIATIIKELYIKMSEKLLILKSKKDQLQQDMKKFAEQQIGQEYSSSLVAIKKYSDENIRLIKDLQRNFIQENEQLCRDIEVPFGNFFMVVNEFSKNVKALKELPQHLPKKIYSPS